MLDRDLEIRAINGVARIVRDDLEGTHDASLEEDDQTSCSDRSKPTSVRQMCTGKQLSSGQQETSWCRFLFEKEA